MQRKKITNSEHIRRITNAPTTPPREPTPPDVLDEPTKRRASGTMNSTAALARFTYLPAADIWRATIAQLLASGAVSLAQVESWLKPCELSMMDLPSGEVCAAALHTPTSHAADHVKHQYAPMIRFVLQQVTQKQVILFVRGPAESPWSGPPDGYETLEIRGEERRREEKRHR